MSKHHVGALLRPVFAVVGNIGRAIVRLTARILWRLRRGARKPRFERLPVDSPAPRYAHDMQERRLEIHAATMAGHTTSISYGGRRVPGVKSMTLLCEVGRVNRVILELVPGSIDAGLFAAVVTKSSERTDWPLAPER